MKKCQKNRKFNRNKRKEKCKCRLRFKKPGKNVEERSSDWKMS